MQLKENEYDQRNGFKLPLGVPPKHGHNDKNRSFHQRPSDFVINGNTPSITPKNAVTRFQEIEYNEYDCGNTAHYQQEYIETPR